MVDVIDEALPVLVGVTWISNQVIVCVHLRNMAGVISVAELGKALFHQQPDDPLVDKEIWLSL